MYAMRLILLLAVGAMLCGCFGDDDAPATDAALDAAAPVADAATMDAAGRDAADGAVSECGTCESGAVCVQYRRHELRCIPLSNVPAWNSGRCGDDGQECCALLVPEVGIATDVCRPGLVCQVVGLLPAWKAKCGP